MSLIAFLLGKVVNYIIYLISSNVRFYLASVIAYIRYQLNLFSETNKPSVTKQHPPRIQFQTYHWIVDVCSSILSLKALSQFQYIMFNDN